MTRRELQENDHYLDFHLINKKPIDELQMTLYELVHVPTGAQVMHLEADDPENLFCLSFKTLPSNSNGVAHILEHTVLCGSRKFPVKDPFFSMNRRSLNTFMNAMTGSDFTCYPASSLVEKDFYNLLDVYLDAVFHPLLKEQSFLQEGHRLEFAKADDPNSPLEYKGIVYNEMKGAMTSADSRIWHEVLRVLVPDLPYAHNSGGDPTEIPSLTYKQLIDFHDTYYHPSRCLFFFYGDLPLKKHLDFIHEHVLSKAQKASPLDGIAHQTPFKKPIRSSSRYPSLEKENLEKKHIYAMAYLTAPLLQQEEVLALTLLDSILMDTDASILKKALLDTKMCVQADSFLDTEMTEIVLMFFLKGCAEKDGPQLEKTIHDTLSKIAKDGIDYEEVEAALHQLELSRTEIGGDHNPFGLTLFMRSCLAKQHGCNPENSLMTHSLFSTMREKVRNRHYFTPLINKYFLNNPHFAFLHFAPDANLAKEEDEREKQHLDSLKHALSDKEKTQIIDEAKALVSFQEEQENQSLNCLPKVELSDVPYKATDYPLQTNKHGKAVTYHHPTFTNHLVYVDLLFDLPKLTEEELFDLQLFLTVWTEVGAGKRGYEENLALIHAHTGGIGAHSALHVQADDPNLCRPTLQLHGKALQHKAPELFGLLKDFVVSPRLDETDRIKDVIRKLANALQHRFTQSSMRYATQLSLSGNSPASYINQKWHGLSFYQELQKLMVDIDQGKDTLVKRLHNLKEKLLQAAPPQLVLSCDQTQFDELTKEHYFGLLDLPTSNIQPWDFSKSLPKIENQAHVTSSPVAFTAQSYKCVSYLHRDAPALQAATLLLENKVLHRRIREQGGAYGSGAQFNPLWGNFYFYSYRDPHIANTLKAFEESVDAISRGVFDEQDLEEAKLGIIQHFDTPTSPGHRALTSYTWQRDQKTLAARQQFRDRLLELSPLDIEEAVNHHLVKQWNDGVTVTFAGKELLDKELPKLKEKSLKRIEPS